MSDLRPNRPRIVLALLFAVVGATARPVSAAEVAGKVTIPAQPPTAESPEAPHARGYWEEWNGFIDPRPRRFDPRRELAVILAGSPSSAPVGCTYAIDGGDLSPRTMVVRAGSSFRIENRGPADHELHAPGLAELTPLQTAPGNARTAAVPRPGTFPVADRLFPHVRGHLVAVEDLVACAEVAPDGTYVFPEVMPGTYTVRVYWNGQVVGQAPAEVGARKLTVDAITIALRSAGS